MSLFIFPVPSAASPLPHPVRQPCWVSHSLPELLAFTCVISLASLECLSSSKSQVHCCLLRELLGAFQFLPLGWKDLLLCLDSGGPWKPLLVWNLSLLIVVVLTLSMAPDTESMFSEQTAETEQINQMNVCDTKLHVKSFAHMLRRKLQWNG